MDTSHASRHFPHFAPFLSRHFSSSTVGRNVLLFSKPTRLMSAESGQIFEHHLPWDGDSVRVGCLEDVADMSAQLLIASGMVNGFTPRPSALDATKTMPDKRDRIIAKEADLLAFACSRCQGSAYATGFELIEASIAEKFKLSVDRIFIMEGMRVAKAQPSAVLDELETRE